MPRLIVLLFILISLATVAVQNRATELPLVLLSSETPPIPVGLLLVGSVCIGSFVTVVLYGLVGLGRPPESKYRPMGQRVPYPDSPGSTTLPPSGPASGPVGSPGSTGSSYSRPGDSYAGGSSSAFVSSPPTAQPTTTPKDSTSKSSAPPIQDAAVGTSSSSSSGTSSSSHSSGSSTDKLTDSSAGSSSGGSTGKKQGIASGFKRHFGSNAPTPPVPDSQSATEPGGKSTDGQSGIDNLKKKFKRLGRRSDKEPSEPSESAGVNQSQRRVGDDWGELRTVAHRNSWDAIEEGDQDKGLFGFLQPGSSTRQSAERIAGEIASGWSGSGQGREYADAGYEDSYGSPQYDPQFASREYSASAGRYSQTGYDELDQGWENFDDYDAPPPVNYRSTESRSGQRNGQRENRRVYGESLYGAQEEEYSEPRYREGPYVEDDYLDEGFEEAPANEIGPDGVYEADYRVIVPPSKALDDDDDYIG